LKSSYPTLLLAAVLGTTVYISFKHKPAEPLDTVSATPEEREDQISLSAMHAEPAPLRSASSVQAPQASPADLAKLQTLKQILANHGDNDPRLDRELRDLSPAAKALMEGQYAAIQSEKRNQRGTIVYLIGREINSAEDVGFLHSVLSEPPCLSLADCKRESRGSTLSDEHHLDSATDTTLAYPQIVALKSIEAFLDDPKSASSPLSQGLAAELEDARRSPMPKIAGLADSIARRYQERMAGKH
jgi:hypothetical protein